MKYLPIILLAIVLTLPAFILLSLRKEIGLRQNNQYKTVFFYNKQNFLYSFTSPKEKLNSIAVRIRNIYLKNSDSIIFNLLSDKKVIRQLKIKGVNMPDGEMIRFAFLEIPDSKNKRFSFVLSAPETEKNDVIGVYTDISGNPVIATYHTFSGYSHLVFTVYQNLINKMLVDKIFIFVYLLLFGFSVFAIKKVVK